MLFRKLPINALFSRGLPKYSDNDTQLETFLKVSNKDFIKGNQTMSHAKCRLSHCILTHNKKRLVRSRILVGVNIQPHVWEKGAAP